MQSFGTTPSGLEVHRISLSGGGLAAHVLTYGAILQDLRLEGVAHPLVLGFPVLEPYLLPSPYFGAMVGRFANRIAHGRASIAGHEYQLDQNFIGKHLLHGGTDGADRQVWQVAGQGDDFVVLTLRMADGHMGFPGNLDVQVTYRLPGEGVLEVTVQAVTDSTTLCNFAHHSYFNLDGRADVREHGLQIEAAHYLPVDAECIPTGDVALVEGTAFDFRKSQAIGASGANYDHNFCLSRQQQTLRKVAELRSLHSGVRMQIETTEPGLQVYDAQWMKVPDHAGLMGVPYGAYAGVALEPQGWPDAPNQVGFPSAELLPGDTYRQVSRFRFLSHS